MGDFRLLLLILGSLWSLEAQAESQIWIRNHTDEVLNIQTTAQSSTPWIEGKQWTPGAKSVQPGEVVSIANFSRKRSHLRGGGATIVARIQPTSGDDHIELRTEVRPSLCGSRLESGAGERASDHVSWNPGEHHSWVVSAQESPFLRRFPFCQGGEERVEFLVEDLDGTNGAPTSAEDCLNVMTYNIWYLFGKPRQAERWKGIPAAVTGNDVVVFTEAFKDKYRDLIVTLLRDEYPYMTAVLDGPRTWINGGVFIASKWPFEGLQQNHGGLYQAQQYVFDESECSGEDCFAAKGIQYVTIRKHDRTFHIFATHLQSTSPVLRSSERASAKLMLQTKRVGAWVASKRIPRDQPVLIAGDLNFDGNDAGILARALKNLNAAMPKRAGRTRHSFMMRRPGSKRQALDYVLYSRAHLWPSEATQETVIPPGLLSDHFPVRAVYAFGEE